MSRVVQGGNGITRKYNALTHKGVDIGWRGGDNDNVLAHSSGTVVWVQIGQKNNKNATGNASYGNAIKIKHSNGYYTLYAHLSEVYVKVGQKVKKEAKIGYIGDSGKAYGKHLHFEVRNTKDVRINPTPYLDADLPGMTITYQTYDCNKKKWLPNVKVDTNDYAGNIGNIVGAIYIDQLTYRVHDKNKNKWLPYVTGRNDFAGNKTSIDGVQIKGATYRVHIKGGNWLDWVSKVDDTNTGYAGIYGKEIDAIQIKVN